MVEKGRADERELNKRTAMDDDACNCRRGRGLRYIGGVVADDACSSNRGLGRQSPRFVANDILADSWLDFLSG